MDPKVMAAIVGMLLCLSSSVASAMSMGGGENGDDTSGGGGPTPAAAAPPPPDPEGNMIDGYITSHIIDPGDSVKGTITECRKIAKDHGYIGIGYRTKEHPTDHYKDTCFFYHKVDSGFSGNSADKAHKTGCTDPSKSWPNCGTPNNLPGYTNAHIIDPGSADKAESFDKCRELAKSKGHKGSAFRTQFHPTDHYRKTCFYYSDTATEFSGNPADGAHVSGCTDATKTWPNC